MPTVSGFASTNAVVTTGWTNPTNAYADDGTYATATIAAKNTIVSSRYGGFGVAAQLPGGVTINSVTVNAQMKVSTTAGIARLGVQAQSPSGTNRGTQTLDTSEPLADTVITQTVTSGTFAWTAADLADGTLFAVIEANQGNNATSVTYSLDYVQVVVDYSTPTSLPGIYDVNALTGLANNDPIAAVPNTGSGTLPDLAQATAGAKPLYITSPGWTVGGKPIARHDGTNDSMVSATSGPFAQPFTIYGVIKYNAWSTGNVNNAWDSNDAGNRHTLAISTAGNFDIYAGAVGVADGAWNTSPHVFTVYYNGASSLMRIDGVQVIAPGTSPGTGSLSGLTVGAGLGGGSLSSLDWAEIRLEGDQTLAQMQAVEAALTSKWLTAPPSGAAQGAQRTSATAAGAKAVAGAAQGAQRTSGVSAKTAAAPSGAARGGQRTSGVAAGGKTVAGAAAGIQRTAGASVGGTPVVPTVLGGALLGTPAFQVGDVQLGTIAQVAAGPAAQGAQRTSGAAAATRATAGAAGAATRVAGTTSGAKAVLGATSGQQRAVGVAAVAKQATAAAAQGGQRTSGAGATRKQAVSAAPGSQRTVGLAAAVKQAVGAAAGPQRTNGFASRIPTGPAVGAVRVAGAVTSGGKQTAGAAQGGQRTASATVAGRATAGAAQGSQRTAGIASRLAGGPAVGLQRQTGTSAGTRGTAGAAQAATRVVGQTVIRKQTAGVAVGTQRAVGVAAKIPTGPARATVRTSGQAAGVKGAAAVAAGVSRTVAVAAGVHGGIGAAAGPTRTSGVGAGKRATSGAAASAQRVSGTGVGSHRTAGAAASAQRVSGTAVVARGAVGAAVGSQRTSGVLVFTITPPPRWVEGDASASGLVEGDSAASGVTEGVLVGAGMVEGSSSL